MSKYFEKGYKCDGGTDIVMQHDLALQPGKMHDVPLYVNVNPPKNHLAIVCPRSSYAMKGIFIANCPIDTNYTGDIRAIVFNASDETIHIKAGDKFCQFIVLKCIPNHYRIKPKFKTKRNKNGWGSSGK